MFEISTDGSAVPEPHSPGPVWTGATPFSEIVLRPKGISAALKAALSAQSRHVLIPWIDQIDAPVRRKLNIEGPVSVRDYGHTSVAPHLAFIDITWYIKNLPESLANRGIDSLSPFLRVKYVVDTRTGKTVYRHTSNPDGIRDRQMRLLKEPGGPLLMAVEIACTDGAEPLILDVEHETYGTGHRGDVPEMLHCFPAQ